MPTPKYSQALVPNQSLQPQTGPYTYKPQEEENRNSGSPLSQEPGFTITPPAGWQKGSLGKTKAVFISPDKDEEAAEPPLVITQPANVQVNIFPLDTPADLNQVSEGLLNLYRQKYPLVIITNQDTEFAGQKAKLQELKVKAEKNQWEHIISYLLLKNNHYVLVSGHSLDSAWSKRAGTLKGSVETFKFTD